MNREEAISLLKELHRDCDGIRTEGIMLMSPDTDDLLSHGYQLHIKTHLSKEALACIAPIVKKHKLAMVNKSERETLVIYRPMKT